VHRHEYPENNRQRFLDLVRAAFFDEILDGHYGCQRAVHLCGRFSFSSSSSFRSPLRQVRCSADLLSFVLFALPEQTLALLEIHLPLFFGLVLALNIRAHNRRYKLLYP